jgi:hypothetical protein
MATDAISKRNSFDRLGVLTKVPIDRIKDKYKTLGRDMPVTFSDVPNIRFEIENPDTTQNARFSAYYDLPYRVSLPGGKSFDGTYSAKVTGKYDDKSTISLNLMEEDPQLEGLGIGRALVGRLAAEAPVGTRVTTSGVYSPFGASVMSSMRKSKLVTGNGSDEIDVIKAKKEFLE